MANEKILIVDDEVNTLGLLRTIFEREGYAVTTVSQGTEAIDKLNYELPQLILLDLLMPDIDGFNLLQRIKSQSQWRHIPVVVLTSRHDVDDKLKALRLGVIDYLTKPFQREELTTRIRNILNHCSQPQNSQSSDGNGKTPQTVLLETLSAGGLKQITPSVRKEAQLGYVYPEAAQILKPEIIGGEVHTLEDMANQGLLKRIYFDTIHLCPLCRHHDLNFREVCPHCASANISPELVIKHLRCNRLILGRKLNGQGNGTCPKCQQPLGQEGVEYLKLHLYRCHTCRRAFDEPRVNCRCMNCDQIFEVDAALSQKIYSYQLATSNKSEPEVWSPSTNNPPSEEESNGLLQQALIENKTEFIKNGFFGKYLDMEIKRAERHQMNITVMSLEFTNLNEMRQKHGPKTSLKLMRNILRLVAKCLRELDQIGIAGPRKLLILLPETHLNIAKILADRIMGYLDRLNYDIRTEINLASYPQDGQNAEEILSMLNMGIEKVNNDVF